MAMTLTFARRVVASSVVALSLSATPALALRYATPTGSNTASCADLAHACSLTTAVNGHGANQPSVNDQIVVGPGQYTLPGPLQPPVRGESILGPGASSATVNAAGVVLDATVATNVSGLTIGGEIVDPGGTLDRLLIDPPPTTAGHVSCQCTGGLLRDSVVFGSGTAGGVVGYVGDGDPTATAKPLTEDYRNDTILAGPDGAVAILIKHTGSDTSVKFEFTAENVIAETTRHLDGVLAGGLIATKVSQSQPGQTTTLAITHSATGANFPSLGGANTITDLSDIAPVLPFVSYPLDLREVAGAPTIDAGLNDPRNGPLDLDGDLRTSGSATDIGAYERQALTVSTTPPVVANNGPSLPIAKPKLKLLSTEVMILPPWPTGDEQVRCTGVTLKCTVHGTLTTFAAHHATKLGTISGTVNGGHKGSLTVNLNGIGWDAVYGASHMHLNVKATVTTTSGLSVTKQTFTIPLQTEPDYS
jgi:hypothetical protein